MKRTTTIALLLLSLSGFCQNPYEVKVAAVEPAQPVDTRSDFAKQFSYIPIEKWEEGMRFIVEPAISYLKDQTLDISDYNSKDRIITYLKQKEWEYKIFVFKGFEQPKDKYSFHASAVMECEGKLYRVATKMSMQYYKEHPESIIEVFAHLAYATDIDKAKDQLVGKTAYILTRDWKAKDAKGESTTIDGMKKFEKVVISQVGLGTADDPVRIAFKSGDKEGFVDVYLSGINSGGTKDIFGAPFDKMFSFEDPRKQYPGISEETWLAIQKGVVKIGMKEAEVILSWGAPTNKNRTILNGKSTVQYVYGKQYVYLDDGIVTSMQTSN